MAPTVANMQRAAQTRTWFSRRQGERFGRLLTWLGTAALVLGALILLMSCAYMLMVPSAAEVAWSPRPAPQREATRPSAPSTPSAPVSPPEPGAVRAQGSLSSNPDSEEACLRRLQREGISFESVPKAVAGGVAWPIHLTGPVGGILIRGGGGRDAATDWLDCRLATTLQAWAPALREKGVVAIDHFSMYRENARVAGSGKPSGHAAGRAIDLGRVELQDGRTLSVLTDWEQRARGADPCADFPDDPEGALLRKLVCDAAASGLFQTIVTPHHNDMHRNHVHLEISSSRESLWIR